MLKQQEQITTLQALVGTAATDVVQVENIQKVKELEADDRLRVMEFLIMQMMEAKMQIDARPKPQYSPSEHQYSTGKFATMGGRDQGPYPVQQMSSSEKKRLTRNYYGTMKPQHVPTVIEENDDLASMSITELDKRKDRRRNTVQAEISMREDEIDDEIG